MSLYSDAFRAFKSIILVEERFERISDRLDELVDEMRHFSDRVTRLETIIEITRPDGTALKIAPEIGQATLARLAKGAKE
jgi:hypothetical protein